MVIIRFDSKILNRYSGFVMAILTKFKNKYYRDSVERLKKKLSTATKFGKSQNRESIKSDAVEQSEIIYLGCDTEDQSVLPNGKMKRINIKSKLKSRLKD